MTDKKILTSTKTIKNKPTWAILVICMVAIGLLKLLEGMGYDYLSLPFRSSIALAIIFMSLGFLQFLNLVNSEKYPLDLRQNLMFGTLFARGFLVVSFVSAFFASGPTYHFFFLNIITGVVSMSVSVGLALSIWIQGNRYR